MFFNYEQAKARIRHAKKTGTGKWQDIFRIIKHQQYDELAAGYDRDPSFFIFRNSA